MSIPVFPLSLPKPIRTNYAEAVPSNLLTSSTDYGSKVRTKGHRRPEQITTTYILNDEQYEALKTFVQDTTGGGALAFDWVHPDKDVYVRAAFLSSSENILERSYWGDTRKWQVSIKFEYFPLVEV